MRHGHARNDGLEMVRVQVPLAHGDIGLCQVVMEQSHLRHPHWQWQLRGSRHGLHPILRRGWISIGVSGRWRIYAL